MVKRNPKGGDTPTASADEVRDFMRRQREVAGGPGPMAKALAGIDLKKVDAKLQELRTRVASVQSLKERMELLKGQREEYAGVWLEARRAFATVEREFGGTQREGPRTLEDLKTSLAGWRARAGIFASDAEKALEVMATVERENPFYTDGLKELNRRSREETKTKVREGAKIETLHEFCEQASARRDVRYALEGSFRPRDANRDLPAVVRLHSTKEGVVVEDANFDFLRRSGLTPDGRLKVYNLQPPIFGVPGGPNVHPVIREMLSATWGREERREKILQEKEEILKLQTISCQEFLAKVAGVAVADHHGWVDGDKKGPATVAVKSDGTTYTVERYLSTAHGDKIKAVAEAGPQPLTDEGMNNIVGRLVRRQATREGANAPAADNGGNGN